MNKKTNRITILLSDRELEQWQEYATNQETGLSLSSFIRFKINQLILKTK